MNTHVYGKKTKTPKLLQLLVIDLRLTPFLCMGFVQAGKGRVQKAGQTEAHLLSAKVKNEQS